MSNSWQVFFFANVHTNTKSPNLTHSSFSWHLQHLALQLLRTMCTWWRVLLQEIFTWCSSPSWHVASWPYPFTPWPVNYPYSWKNQTFVFFFWRVNTRNSHGMRMGPKVFRWRKYVQILLTYHMASNPPTWKFWLFCINGCFGRIMEHLFSGSIGDNGYWWNPVLPASSSS